MRRLCFCFLVLAAGCAEARLFAEDDPNNPNNTDAGFEADAGDGGNVALQCPPSALGWQQVGVEIDPVGPENASAETSIAIDDNGMVYAAVNSLSRDQVVVYRFNNGWQQVGDNLGRIGEGFTYAPILRAAGEDLILSFVESGGATGNGLYAYRFSEGSWQSMGGGDLSSEHALSSPGSIAVHEDGTVLISWSQYSDGVIGRNRMQVLRFEGNNYSHLGAMGGIAGPGASAYSPRVTFQGDSAVAMFSESSATYTKRRGPNDQQWSDLGSGTLLTNGENGHSPMVTTDSQGRLVAASAVWDESTSTSNGFLSIYENGSWTEVADKIDAVPGQETHVQLKSIAVDKDDRPVVAWTEAESFSDPGRLFVARLEGGQFQILGNSYLSGYDGTQTPLGVDLATNECGVYVVFSERPNSETERKAFVYRWAE